MPKLRQHDVKTFKDLQKFAKPYGYKLNAHGKLRQQPWLGLAFDEDGRVVYLKNGAVICESGMSFENCAILIEIIGDIEKHAALEKQNKELKQLLIDCDSLSIVRESLNEATEEDEQNYYAEIEHRLTEALK